MNTYKGKRILVLGLGVSGGGIGAARFLASRGAEVTISDAKTKKELKQSIRKLHRYPRISYIFGGYPSRFQEFDMAIINPAIDLRSRMIKKIATARIPVESEIGLFLKHCEGKIIAITGTKGKGTTATLVYRMLKQAKKDVFLGGNIGVSLLDQLPHIKKSTFVVLEVSSFQLDLLRLGKMRPQFFVSALTNIYPDHLDRYDSFLRYKKSKLSLFGYRAHAKIDGRNMRSVLPRWVDEGRIHIRGEHNKKNIALALAISKKIHIQRVHVQKAIYGFRGLPHRLEYVGRKKEVAFYDDSYSTTPDSTIAALKSFDQKIILIAGGMSKKSSFAAFAREAGKRTNNIILFGKSRNEIARAFKKKNNIIKTKTLEDAFKRAITFAKEGDIVLFSPACASFDQFQNARERGEAFKKFVRGK
ncbi:MAG: hypothetical protein COU47_02150 [Candidatus Niyogibacteria bacterium CG10_big_fil_rev_8_21_14_0_10_46_36]|uniref:UDP-N-acetylmuramoylalanine--D-glutamate ligase n=1 Tax=Candidatus Niyogibacteria bacterium CG10_big_fil_rev_8_21_14_0_10_46_36 TaxID=1974726 RepID=A0A2H0TD99_9BACT|nr:MAG: hypothetical protein COU47_02150 [Candidatus Niyogibacteria bacterium CG10_big_fil_rev_8_21_14_0_10_46_36]